MKFGWKGILGVLLSAFLIWFTLRGESIPEIWGQVREADFILLGAAVFVATFGFLIRALRWRVLLTPLDPDTRLHARWAAVNIGFMANNLLPARVGEFARALSFSKLQPSVSVGGAFGSLVVERVLDGLVLAGMLVLAILSPGFPEVEFGPGFTAVFRAVVTVIGVMVVFLAVLLVFPRPVVALVETVAERLPPRMGGMVVDALHAFLASLAVVKSPRLLISALLWTIGFWVWHGASFWLGMLAFDIELGWVAAFFTEAVVGFGVALPAAPGFFGTFHASVAFALESVYGVDAARTLAFAYGYHLGGFIPVTLIGLWYARQLGLSLAEVGRSEAEVERRIEADPEIPS